MKLHITCLLFAMVYSTASIAQSDSLPFSFEEKSKFHYEISLSYLMQTRTVEIAKSPASIGLGGNLIIETHRRLKPTLGLDLNYSRFMQNAIAGSNSNEYLTEIKHQRTHASVPIGGRLIFKNGSPFFADAGIVFDYTLQHKREAILVVREPFSATRTALPEVNNNSLYTGFYAGFGMNHCFKGGLAFVKAEMRHVYSSTDNLPDYLGSWRLSVGFKW